MTYQIYNVTSRIHHDPRRTNSYYYASVTVTSSEKKDKSTEEKVCETRNLEVILNGSGTSKARKKIEHHLHVLGYLPEEKQSKRIHYHFFPVSAAEENSKQN
jgi:hypothetical protein